VPCLYGLRKLSYLALASVFLRVKDLRRLLFLNGIKAFEAAARSGSFAAAGAELNVSAAAISRMVHLLEERLGVALFERKANRLVTTAAGRAYQSGLTPIFDALASLTAQVTAPASVRVLTIGVGPTFAMKWLIPRLADFRKEAPDIDVRITTGGAAAPFGEDWSCGIKLGDGQWPGLVAEPLFAGDLLPVCAPRLATPLKRPSDLKGPMLLRVAHSPDDWPLWLKAAGARHRVPVLRPRAAGRDRRPRHRDGNPPLYRRRPRGRTAGSAIRVERAEGHALVPGLSRFPHRAARLCRVPPLDHPCRRRAGGAACVAKVKRLILAKYDDENCGYLRIQVDKQYLKIGFHQVGVWSLAQSRARAGRG
jgi:DNA-binding transcriptional LysR family regulator